MQQIFRSASPLRLESGEVISAPEIAYHTYGTLNDSRDNVIWVCHALTANSDVADWWPHTVEEGKFLDPGRYFVVCANVLGSHYGTTGPLSVNPATGAPWYGTFPRFTVRDIVEMHRLLAAHLGIIRVKMLIGSSLGGFQCQEWAIMYPDFAETAVFIATTPRTRPWAAAFNESQRMAIEADATYGAPRPDAGAAGMAAARSIALLSYRGDTAYNLTQEERQPLPSPFDRRVHSYQRHQGDKIVSRFNAYSYYRLSQAVDSHDIGRSRGSVAEALAGVKARCLVVAITSDILFPPADHDEFRRYLPQVEYHEIESEYGHDGFLIEHAKLNDIITRFLARS